METINQEYDLSSAGININHILRIGDAAAAMLQYCNEHDNGRDPVVPRYLMDELSASLSDLTTFMEAVNALIKARENAS